MQDGLRGQMLGGDHAAHRDLVDDAIKVGLVDLGDQLGVAHPVGVQGQHDVLLVKIGQGDKGVGGFKALLQQQLFVGGVAVDDVGLGQQLAELVAALPAVFDDGDMDAGLDEPPGQIIGHGAASHDHHMLDGFGLDTDAPEGVRHLFRGYHQRDPVPGVEHRVSVWDNDLLVGFHHGYQQGSRALAGDLNQVFSVPGRALGDDQGGHMYPSLGEGVQIDGGGAADQVIGVIARRQLRVNGQGQPQLILDEVDFLIIFRIAHPGDGPAVARLFGDEAAEHIDLVPVGNGDQNVTVLDAGVQQSSVAAAVALDGDDVQGRHP